jgi:ABC-type glycerol-3-phosphate transport system substrate-binding protein
LIELFEAQHPDIQVNLVSTDSLISGDEIDTTAALAAAVDIFPYAPDVFYEGQAALLDLELLLALDANFQADDFHSGLLNTDGSFFSLPVVASYPLLFFDKAAFDAAGLSYPQPGWTLAEFLAVAQTLTQRDGTTVTRWGYVPAYIQPMFSIQLGNSLLADQNAQFANEEVVTALEWVANLFTTYQVSPWLEAYKPFDMRTGSSTSPDDLISAGQAAMWSGGHRRGQSLTDSDQIGVVPLPHAPQGYALEPIRSAFAISRGTANQAAAWELLTFLSQQPPVGDINQILVPARRSVAATANYWESIPETLAVPLQYAVEQNAGARGSIAWLPALTEVVENGTAAAEALATVQTSAAEKMINPEVIITPLPTSTPLETDTPITKITFVTGWNQTETQRELAKTFQDEHPGIWVNVVRRDTAKDFYQEIDQADCFAGNVLLVDVAGVVKPLDPLLELDSTLGYDDFFPGTITAVTQDGELLGLPAWIDIPLIEYNRGLFAAAGIPEPQPGWTLVDFLKTAQTLTDSRTGQYGYIDWPWQSLTAFGPAQFDVHLLDDSEEDIVGIDYAAATPMVGWYADLIMHYGVHPVLPGDLTSWDDYFDRSDLFYELAQAEKVAM